MGYMSRKCAKKLMGESAQETSQAWLDDVKLRSRLKTSIRRGLNCSETHSQAAQSVPTWSSAFLLIVFYLLLQKTEWQQHEDTCFLQ